MTMQTNTVKTIILTDEEIRKAIKLWMENENGIVLDDNTVIDFDTQEVWDSSDWQGRWGPIGAKVTGAGIIVKSKS